MNFIKIALSALFIYILSSQVKAQNICVQKLKSAQAAYDEGRINEVPDQLLDCINAGFTKEERIAAYKLLTLTYLYLNEKANAELYMGKFLHLDPEYRINTAVDPPEFINLYNMFRTAPIFLWGLRAGANRIVINETAHYTVDNVNSIDRTYSPSLGYQVGLSFDIPLTKKIYVNPELYFSGRKYTYKDNLLNFADLTVVESQNWITMPVIFKYQFDNKKIQPYIGIGGAVDFLMSSKIDISRQDLVAGETKEAAKDAGLDMISKRNRLNYGAVIAIGTRFKDLIGKGYLVVEAKYYYGLSNVTNTKNRYNEDDLNKNLIFNYGYVSSDIQQSTLMLSLGYTLPKYNPKIPKKRRK